MSPAPSTDREPGPPVRPGPAATAPPPPPATGSGDGIPLGRPSPSPGSGQPGTGSVASATGRDTGSTGAITQYARPQGGYRSTRGIPPPRGASASRARPCCESTSSSTAVWGTCSCRKPPDTPISTRPPPTPCAAGASTPRGAAMTRWPVGPAPRRVPPQVNAQAAEKGSLLFSAACSEEILGMTFFPLSVAHRRSGRPRRGRHRLRASSCLPSQARSRGRRVERPALRAHAHGRTGARGHRPHAGRRRAGPAEDDRGVARGQPEGRARLRARRADPAALRRRRREPALDPRLGPAQQFPPARHQRADRRLPLRQCRRLQRLRIARAPEHPVHRGLQGRERAPLRRQYHGRRHQPRQQDRLDGRPHREPRRGRLLRLLQGLSRHGAGLRPARSLRELQRHGAAGVSRAQRADEVPGLRHRRLHASRRHHASLRPRLRPQRGAAPGRAHARSSSSRTRSSRIRPRSSPRRRATTTTPAAPSRCARRSETTRSSSGRPSSTTRTSTTRCPSPSSTTRRTPTAPSCAISGPRRSSAAAIASPRASSSSARGRTTPSSRTSTATAAA